jgi:hypothetical protein
MDFRDREMDVRVGTQRAISLRQLGIQRRLQATQQSSQGGRRSDSVPAAQGRSASDPLNDSTSIPPPPMSDADTPQRAAGGPTPVDFSRVPIERGRFRGPGPQGIAFPTARRER